MQQMLQQIAASTAAKTAAQKPATKTASKAAKPSTGPAKKNPSKADTAPKAAPKVHTVAPKAKGNLTSANKPEMAIKYAVSDFARPTAGRALAAHTAAFLGLSGMGAGAAVPRAMATKIIGARAIQWHTGNGNFELTADGLKLTPKGEIAFLSRAIDPELLAAYEEVMQTGKINELANVKTESSRVKL